MKKNNVATIIPTAAVTIDPLHNTITFNKNYMKKNSYSNTTTYNVDNVVALNDKLNNAELDQKHRDILDSVVSSCRENIEKAFIQLLDSKSEDTKKAEKINSEVASLQVPKKRKYITKSQVMEVWDYYLDDTSIDKIAEDTGLTDKEVNRVIVNQYRPVHPRHMKKKYSDQDIVDYNYIKNVYAEVIRRCRVKLYRNTRALSEKRHFEGGMPWNEAIITPLEYISTEPALIKVFNEIATQYKNAIKTQKIKTLK